MPAQLHRYRIEIITAAVCGTICLAVLFPDIRGSFQGWFQSSPAAKSDDFSKERGQYLVEGATPRDSVTQRVTAIRRATERLNGMNLANVSRRDADQLRHLVVGFHGADLRGLDLHGLDLCGIDFRDANLTGANLSGAQLLGTVFFRARLMDVNLTGAQLGPRPMDLPNFQWRGNEPGDDDPAFSPLPYAGHGGRYLAADFYGADLSRAYIVLTTSESMNLCGANLTDATLTFAPPRRPSGPDESTLGILYDDKTVVTGLQIGGFIDRLVPFVAWAIERGAVRVSPENGDGLPVDSASPTPVGATGS